MRGVAVTGIGVVSAFGVGTEPFWRGLVSGASPLAPGPGGVCVGRVPDLDVRAFVRTPGGRRIDRASLLALAAARLALADARLPDATAPDRTGLALGSALADLGETTVFMDRVFERGAGNPLLFPNMVMNAPLAYVSIELGITGPTAMVSELEVSGEAAIAWGARAVLAGEADVCLAGATDELADVLPRVLPGLRMATRDVARPLDRGADGAALGEGAAVLVLESCERARARGARVYAELLPSVGFTVPSPVHGYAREADALVRRLRAVLEGAALVVAGASGLRAHDALEARVLARTIGGAVPVTAPRGALGQFGAAGALAVAAAALALHDGRVPPTVGCRLPARDGLDVVVGAARPSRPAVAVVPGIGRGGLCRALRLVRSAGA